jgi:hypothetical protein
MARHIIGNRLNELGSLVRFTHEYSDAEFEELVSFVGGFLPPGWVAWHLEDDKNIENSMRVQALLQIPSYVEIHNKELSKNTISMMLFRHVVEYKTLGTVR